MTTATMSLTSRPMGVLVLLLTFWIGTVMANNGKPQARLSTISLLIDNLVVTAEVAAHPQHRQRGLSYRTSMPENEGMLFVYQEERKLLFTMRETLIPLSIAFISEDLTINEILEMEPGAKANYPSSFHSKFALEMNEGWFRKNNIQVGTKISIQY